eukprot:TRINITY_DN2130_c0_g2_i2.p1 TRINITY_DN2130_c0_g2~~TRINITY_DN2130_c0_g2_i2.p1  ORF type:complete len:118 (+),score=15.77 TRINITY_DN2130_c0_g2_i2:40-393(+)
MEEREVTNVIYSLRNSFCTSFIIEKIGAIPYLGFILSSHCKFRTPSPSSKTHIMLSEQPDHHTPEMQINSKTSSNHSTNTTHVDPMQYSTSIAISLLNYLQGYINSLNSSLLIRELY